MRHLRYQLSNAVNDDGTYTDGGWYICEEEEKAAGVGQEPMFDGRLPETNHRMTRVELLIPNGNIICWEKSILLV